MKQLYKYDSYYLLHMHNQHFKVHHMLLLVQHTLIYLQPNNISILLHHINYIHYHLSIFNPMMSNSMQIRYIHLYMFNYLHQYMKILENYMLYDINYQQYIFHLYYIKHIPMSQIFNIQVVLLQSHMMLLYHICNHYIQLQMKHYDKQYFLHMN